MLRQLRHSVRMREVAWDQAQSSHLVPMLVKPVREGIEINDGDLELRFIAYSSEVHLQDGVLCRDNNSGIMETENSC